MGRVPPNPLSAGYFDDWYRDKSDNPQVKLRGISMTSPDIRAGVSLLIAALSAQGKSTIYNIEQIERGYQHIDERLRALGADIKRI